MAKIAKSEGLGICFSRAFLLSSLHMKARQPFTLFTLIALWAVQIWTFSTHYQQHPLSWDVFGYYLYLPATFIHQDPAIQGDWIQEVYSDYSPSDTPYQLNKLDGKHVNKYSAGMAVLYSPAFAVGHGIATFSDAPADGFSEPYQHALTIWSLIVAMLGVWFLSKALKYWFPDKQIALMLAILVIGTNYLFTALVSVNMAHNYLFTLVGLLLWACSAYHHHKQAKWLPVMAVSVALMALARPTEVIFVLLPLFWGFKTNDSFLKRALTQRKHLLLSIVLFVLIGSIQLIYWKVSSGSWIYYSYNNPGEGLDFTHPYILEVLFSYRKGWLLYTPLMIIAVVGLVPLSRSNFPAKWPAIIILLLHFYLVACWTNWWYAESFSQRPMVQAYPLWALAMGSMLLKILNRGKVLKGFAFAMVFVLVGLNLFQSWQVSKNILHPSRTTKDYYWSVLGKTYIPKGATSQLLIDRTPVNGEVPWPNRDSYTRSLVKDWEFSAEDYFEGTKEFHLVSKWPNDELLVAHPTWLMLELETQKDPALGFPDVVMTYIHDNKAHNYQQRSPVWKRTGDTWSTEVHYLIPELQRPNDLFQFQLYNFDRHVFELSGLRLYKYDLPRKD